MESRKPDATGTHEKCGPYEVSQQENSWGKPVVVVRLTDAGMCTEDTSFTKPFTLNQNGEVLISAYKHQYIKDILQESGYDIREQR